ncbi:choice-of-anchor A family protein [Streptomyces cinnamoneus]|uniref:choice-of-anchor A family protein n=1 Tax=Streptomyces cinnamoneus TaxID=53446 RepID=UPI00167EAA0A|nr:choice-of-anchor A family protein [Streptomyces cinnamoneus]
MSQNGCARRRVSRPVATVLATLAAIGGTLLAGAFTAPEAGRAEPVATGPGPCVPGACPGAYPEPHNGPVKGRDNGVNVFVGGDYAVRRAAAAAEGRVVVLGDFDLAKGAGLPPAYHVGVVGLGSRVPPDNGSAFLRVGGDLKLAAGQRLVAEEGAVTGTVTYAGNATGPGTVSPKAAHDVAAVAAVQGLREELTATSTCYAYDKGVARKATGTAVNHGAATAFTGDGISALQVFTVPFDLTAPGGGPQNLTFARIPARATVLVNLTRPGSEAQTISTSAAKVAGVQRERLLWNVPDAREVRLAGTGQLDGSLLVGRRSSLTHLSLPGVNGRLFTAGSLSHESAGAAGPSIHAYPFTGRLPDCGTAPTPEAGNHLPVPVPAGPHPGAPPPNAPVAGDGHELAHGGPPMSTDMVLGAALMTTGAGMALIVLHRQRPHPRWD